MFSALLGRGGGHFSIVSVSLVVFHGKTRLCNTALPFQLLAPRPAFFVAQRVGMCKQDEVVVGQARRLVRMAVGAL